MSTSNPHCLSARHHRRGHGFPRVALALLLASAGLLGACVVVPAYGPAVDTAPPPPQVEVIGVAPAPGWFWIGGYWAWYGGRHTWVGGHWEAPRPGWVWAPHRWHHDGRAWHEAPGRWERR